MPGVAARVVGSKRCHTAMCEMCVRTGRRSWLPATTCDVLRMFNKQESRGGWRESVGTGDVHHRVRSAPHAWQQQQARKAAAQQVHSLSVWTITSVWVGKLRQSATQVMDARRCWRHRHATRGCQAGVDGRAVPGGAPGLGGRVRIRPTGAVQHLSPNQG